MSKESHIGEKDLEASFSQDMGFTQSHEKKRTFILLRKLPGTILCSPEMFENPRVSAPHFGGGQSSLANVSCQLKHLKSAAKAFRSKQKKKRRSRRS